VTDFMDPAQFRDEGWLLEVNRLFFHPRGLALAMSFSKGRKRATGFVGVLDARSDPEGYVFEPDQFEPDDRAKAKAIEAIRKSKLEARSKWGTAKNGIQAIPRVPKRQNQ
jgi:hypothetical protein